MYVNTTTTTLSVDQLTKAYTLLQEYPSASTISIITVMENGVLKTKVLFFADLLQQLACEDLT